MEFSIIKKETEIKRIRKELMNEFKSQYPKDSKVISHSMHAIPFPFPKLLQRILDSSHQKKFTIHYFLKSNHSFIKDIIPASEYYKVVFLAISDKLYSLQTSLKNINNLTNEIFQIYKKKSSMNPSTKQKYIEFDNEVYSLKRELSVFLFDSRSLLDTITLMFHFLYGPKSRQFGSFSDFVKMCEKDPQKSKFDDSEMREYIINNCYWFYLLKDVRDYVTHLSSIDISFCESNKGQLKIYVFGRNLIDLENLISSVIKGIISLRNFIDEHFSKRLSKEQPNKTS